VVCAVDRELRDFLRDMQRQSTRARLVSAQPYLMFAFNLRRKALNGHTGWFVVQEPGRLALGLIKDGEWQSIRRRTYEHRWQDALPALLDRESGANELPSSDRIFLWTEDEGAIPERLGRYAVTDVTSPRTGLSVDRRFAMASLY
jgi:hypothetical protein